MPGKVNYEMLAALTRNPSDDKPSRREVGKKARPNQKGE